MARSTPIQLSFNGGEIAPAWTARADLERFGSSLAVMQNFIPMVQGPALRRAYPTLRFGRGTFRCPKSHPSPGSVICRE